jgi:hypothetical protein
MSRSCLAGDRGGIGQRALAEPGRPRSLMPHQTAAGLTRSSQHACHADPPRLHGPYWHWNAKVNGKTVNRRLSPREAELYTDWISNDRRVHALLTQMRDLASKATDLILTDQPDG